jgi:hypothetical protein
MLTENIIQFDPLSIWNLELYPSCDQVEIGKMEQQWEHGAVHSVFD